MTYERGEGDNEAYLIGPGFDLAIPGFNYFTLNFYVQHRGQPPRGQCGRSPRPGRTPCRWASPTS